MGSLFVIKLTLVSLALILSAHFLNYTPFDDEIEKHNDRCNNKKSECVQRMFLFLYFLTLLFFFPYSFPRIFISFKEVKETKAFRSRELDFFHLLLYYLHFIFTLVIEILE